MFTFIHAADIHLDSPLRGLTSHPDAPAEEIRSATRRALKNLVSLAIDESIDFLLIAGDLYDGDWQDFNTGLFFNAQMRRLREASIPVYLISGNHDAKSKITKSLNPPETVHTFPTEKPNSLKVQGLPVIIHGQGFSTPSIQENLATSYPPPAKDVFNIGLLHCSVGDSPNHSSYAPCTLTDLRDKQYDYWALGHIHQPELLSDQPYIAYSGNTQGRHARETGPRGCYLVTVDDELNIQSHTFRELDVVRWEHITLDISDIDEENAAIQMIRQAFKSILTSEHLFCVRLTLTGKTSLHGDLHLYPQNWLAKLLDLAQDISHDLLWIEKLQLKTSPPVDLGILAQQSDLTAQVLEALETLDPKTPLPIVEKLSAKLPLSVSPTDISVTHTDISALVIETLVSKSKTASS